MYKILFLYVFTRFEHNVMKISEPDVQVSLGSFLLVPPGSAQEGLGHEYFNLRITHIVEFCLFYWLIFVF